MAALSFEHAQEARAALLAIVSDPEHGADALSSAQTMANLLHDLLPDAPREAGLLTAAVTAGLPAMLRSYAAQGMDGETAVSLAGAAFAARTAFTPDACEWVAAELAVALGLETRGRMASHPAPLGLETDAHVGRIAASLGRDTLSLTSIEPGISTAAGRSAARGRRKVTYAFGSVVMALAVAAALVIGFAEGRHRAAPPHASFGTTGPVRSAPSVTGSSAATSPSAEPSALGSPAATPTACGTVATAANVTVTVTVVRGDASCAVAIAIEQDYAAALRAGAAPGNGGGGPVNVHGWTCQGFATPVVLHTGKASECVEDGIEILTRLPG